MVDGLVTENGRLSGVALRAIERRAVGDRGRAGAVGALCSSERAVLGAFLDAAAWLRDGIDGLERGGRRAKKGRVDVLENNRRGATGSVLTVHDEAARGLGGEPGWALGV